MVLERVFFTKWYFFVVIVGLMVAALLAFADVGVSAPEKKETSTAQAKESDSKALATTGVTLDESSIDSPSIFTRAWRGGLIVFTVLLTLIILSILSWAVLITKLMYLSKLNKLNVGFVKNFWDSRSLNDLNNKLADHPYSPVKEVFRSGYSELVRSSQLKDHSVVSDVVTVSAAVENMTRSLQKAKLTEKARLEKFLSVLSISASASPFIGLFGTVWGIMGAFEGIAQTGSASLSAVAPGISEALIATAFGLAAAIPAVIGFNLSMAKIRHHVTSMDSFSADFLNIVERYLVSDRSKAASAETHT